VDSVGLKLRAIDRRHRHREAAPIKPGAGSAAAAIHNRIGDLAPGLLCNDGRICFRRAPAFKGKLYRKTSKAISVFTDGLFANSA